MRLSFSGRWFAALAPVVLCLLLPLGLLSPVYWQIVGWLRGEATFQDRPTSFWVAEAYGYEEYLMAQTSAPLNAPPPPTAWMPVRRYGLVEWVLMYLGVPPRPAPRASTVLDGDPAALPVLLEMANHADLKIRRVAAYGLHAQCNPPNAKPAAIDALKRLAMDPDRRLSNDSARYLSMTVPGYSSTATGTDVLPSGR
jgi:hypothetical protein